MTHNTCDQKIEQLQDTLSIIDSKIDRVVHNLTKDDDRRDRWLGMLTNLLRLKKILDHAIFIVKLDQDRVPVRVYNSALRESVENVTPYLVHWQDFYTLIRTTAPAIDLDFLKDKSLRNYLAIAIEA